MNRICKRITALILVLLMTASLLASCSGGEWERVAGDWPIPVYDEYVGKVIDLGLTEDEKIMDVTETEDGFRVTIGSTYKRIEETYGEYGTPYLTQYRYYDADFVEDEEKCEDTSALYEVAAYGDPGVDLVLGGDPYPKGDAYYGAQYHFRRDGEADTNLVIPEDLTTESGGPYTYYGVSAHILQDEDTIYAGIRYSGMDMWWIYINDHFLEVPFPDVMQSRYTMNIPCGLLAIEGKPYALVREDEYTHNGAVVDVVRESGRLVPLTPDTVELPLEGSEIKGVPTGGAFSDGKFGYFFCEGELWRTNGKKSACIADLTDFEVDARSEVRSVRSLSDGRILVVADGQMICLTGKKVAKEEDMQTDTGEKKKVYTIGLINDYGYRDRVYLAAAKFQSETATFKVKEFRDQTNLNLAILSGEVHMVATHDLFLLRNYVKQDLLAPLDQVAPELFEEGVLIESVVNATRVDGVCYYLPRKFNITGEAVDARVLEVGQTFETREEYLDFLMQDEIGYVGGPRLKEDAFMFFAEDLDEWIDWENNTCHFDGDTFKKVLEFSNKASTWADIEANRVNWDTHLSYFNLQGVIQPTQYDSIEEAKAYLASLPEGQRESAWALVYFPLPSAVYDGYAIDAVPFYAVVNREENLEAAGEFMRWHFMDDVEKTTDDVWIQLSINRAESERYFTRNISAADRIDVSTPRKMQEYLAGRDEGQEIEAAVDRYIRTWEVIHQADHFKYFRNDVYNIMHEEASRYFFGLITLDQAAEYIQNRVSIYLAEQG